MGNLLPNRASWGILPNMIDPRYSLRHVPQVQLSQLTIHGIAIGYLWFINTAGSRNDLKAQHGKFKPGYFNPLNK